LWALSIFPVAPFVPLLLHSILALLLNLEWLVDKESATLAVVVVHRTETMEKAQLEEEEEVNGQL